MASKYDRKMKRILNENSEQEKYDEIERLERSVKLLKTQNREQKQKMKQMMNTFSKRPQTSKIRHPTHRSVVNTLQQSNRPSYNKSKLLQTIDSLKRQLFKTNDKVKRLQSDLTKSRAQGGGIGVGELQDKEIAITQLKGKLSSHVMSYEALQKRYEKGQDKLKELNMLLNQLKKEKISLERENQNLRNEATQVLQLQEQLKDQQSSYKMLLAKFDDLCDSPFSEVEGPKVSRHQITEYQNQIQKLKNDLQAETNHKELLEAQQNKLSEKFEKLEQKLEKKQDELNQLKVEALEKTKSLGTYKRQMDILNLDNNLDQDLFHKVLGQVKWQGEEPAWHRVEFIERTHEID